MYRQWEEVDKAILLFIFMPLIRAELIEFVNNYNAYPIRRQPKREYHVAGVPDELYEDQEKQCGFAVNQEALNEWKSKVTAFGKLICFAHHFFSVANHLYDSETDHHAQIYIATERFLVLADPSQFCIFNDRPRFDDVLLGQPPTA